MSSSSSNLLGALGLSRKPSNALIWIRGHVVAFKVAISCDGLSIIDRRARPLQALPVCLWATSRSLNTSLSRSHWLSVSGVSFSIDVTTSSPSGASSSGITNSSISSHSSVLGLSARHMGSPTEWRTLVISASAI